VQATLGASDVINQFGHVINIVHELGGKGGEGGKKLAADIRSHQHSRQAGNVQEGIYKQGDSLAGKSEKIVKKSNLQ
jgi:hypothetical protein